MAVRAAATLSFICPKPGLYTGDGRDYCGDIRIASLGLPEAWTPTWPANSGELNQPEPQQLPMLARAATTATKAVTAAWRWWAGPMAWLARRCWRRGQRC